MTNFLVTANEIGKTSWKVILTCLFIIVAFFAIFGLIGRVVELIIDRQAKKVDKFMSPLIVSGLIDDDKTFTKTAFKKIRIYFFKTSIAPIFLMIISLLIYIIYHGIDGNWSESIFNDETGIGTLLFTSTNILVNLNKLTITYGNMKHKFKVDEDVYKVMDDIISLSVRNIVYNNIIEI